MDEEIVYQGDSQFAHYQIVDMIYGGRKARVLYSGQRQAAQSGVAKDGQDDLLFDYNQRFRELVFGLRPQRILLIGGGVLTLPTALLTEFPDLLIDVVELDGNLIKLAAKYFDFKPHSRLRLHVGDGYKFLKASKQIYDLILVDAYGDTEIPGRMQTAKMAKLLRQHLQPTGLAAFNIISAYQGERSQTLHRQISAMQKIFGQMQLFPAGLEDSLWYPQNFVLTLQNDGPDPAPHLRYAPVAIPKPI